MDWTKKKRKEKNRNNLVVTVKRSTYDKQNAQLAAAEAYVLHTDLLDKENQFLGTLESIENDVINLKLVLNENNADSGKKKTGLCKQD